MKLFLKCSLIIVLWASCALAGGKTDGDARAANGKSKARHGTHAVKASDIAVAVKAASTQDCGCGECAGKGCKPCHGKNCYYCVAKGLTTNECGCGKCDAKGCDVCGPGCDVCKFHLKPLGEAKNGHKRE